MITDEQIRDLLKRFLVIPTQVFHAKVVDIDLNNYSCTVTPFEGADLQEVRLKASIEVEYEGFVEIPTVGSSVLVGLIGNDADTAYIVKCSKVSKIIINGGELGGLVKIEELRDSLDSIKDYIADLKSAISTGLDSVGVGSAASGTLGKTAFETAMIGKTITIENMENDKVTH